MRPRSRSGCSPRGDRRHPGGHRGRQPGEGPQSAPAPRRNSRRPAGRSSTVMPRVPSCPSSTWSRSAPTRRPATRSQPPCRWPAVADELGYHRYWLAEHHNMPAVAATNPPVLIGPGRRRDRRGSGSAPGGVMLPNHAPLVVAEQFALLEAAYPGRIDLGIGRAPGTDPVTTCALRHGAGGVSDEAVAQFPEYVDNVLAMMEPDGVGLQRRRAGPTRCGRRRGAPVGADDLAARLLGLLGPAGGREGHALRLRPPLLRAPAPPRRSSSTARRSGPRPSWPSRARS